MINSVCRQVREDYILKEADRYCKTGQWEIVWDSTPNKDMNRFWKRVRENDEREELIVRCS